MQVDRSLLTFVRSNATPITRIHLNDTNNKLIRYIYTIQITSCYSCQIRVFRVGLSDEQKRGAIEANG